MIESKAQSEIVMFVPHLEHGYGNDPRTRRPMKFTCDENTPVIGMYKQELQGWQSARITSISRQEITLFSTTRNGLRGRSGSWSPRRQESWFSCGLLGKGSKSCSDSRTG